ncbi:MAG: hypothetical protein FJ026_07625 [Chloroflexi bacterium]|nr:hypothetical protein [Chloroflexota bacterium]
MTAVSPKEMPGAGEVRFAVVYTIGWRAALTISRKPAEQLPSASLDPIPWLLREIATPETRVLLDRSSSPVALECLRCLFHVEGEGPAELLSRWPDLALVVQDAHPHLQAYFGRQAGLLLEATRDPEVPTDQRVVVTIRTDLEPEEALNRLNAFYRAWWFGAIGRAHGRLVFNVELL